MIEPAFRGGGTYAKASQSLHDRDRTVMRMSLGVGDFFSARFLAHLLMLGLYFFTLKTLDWDWEDFAKDALLFADDFGIFWRQNDHF